MADLVFKNFAGTQIAFDIDAVTDTILVQDGSVFPDAPAEGEFICVIEDVDANKEIVRCTSRSGNTLTVTRAFEDATDYPARSWVVGDQIELRYTAGAVEEFFQRIGLDAATWDPGQAGLPTRKTLQIRRNYANPGATPIDLYEGELVVNGANATPLLFLGPSGANNDGTGIPVLPIALSENPPVNPYERLIWIHATTYQIQIYDGTAWQEVTAQEVTGQYATQAYVDAELADVRANLNAPAFTRLIFPQAAAPAGWVQDTAINDRTISIVSGAGGGQGGSWDMSGFFSVEGHSLSVAEMPAHNHNGGNHTHQVGSVIGSTVGPQTTLSSGTGVLSAASGTIIATQGSGVAHNHDITEPSNWRPAYLEAIVAYKE